MTATKKVSATVERMKRKIASFFASLRKSLLSLIVPPPNLLLHSRPTLQFRGNISRSLCLANCRLFFFPANFLFFRTFRELYSFLNEWAAEDEADTQFSKPSLSCCSYRILPGGFHSSQPCVGNSGKEGRWVLCASRGVCYSIPSPLGE